MKLHLEIKAIQLKNGDKIFSGQTVKNYPTAKDKEGNIIPYEPGKDAELFANIPYRGELLKVNEGMWLVEYPDGTLEVWNDDQIKNNTDFYNIEEEIQEQEPSVGDPDIHSSEIV